MQHSACTRRFWIRHVFSGETVDFSWPGRAEQEWVPGPDATVESLSAFHRAEYENSLRHAGHADVGRELLDGATELDP